MWQPGARQREIRCTATNRLIDLQDQTLRQLASCRQILSRHQSTYGIIIIGKSVQSAMVLGISFLRNPWRFGHFVGFY